jgi:BirA family biotin operon repressor/biotin-[acetyl-CoA-carboxylase] ligase
MTAYTFRHIATTASTNDDVKAAGEAGEAEGLILTADTQTSGRGRQGRVWQSPEGNLYCSILLRPQNLNMGFFSFVASLAIYDVVRNYLPDATIELKWPNDVLVSGKKISGILLEAGDNYLVVGIGLNVKHLPENPLYPATSLSAEGASVELTDLPSKLMQNLWRWYQALQNDGFEPIRAAWLERARKGEVTAKLPQGDVQGRFADIDEKGHLRLILADGSERSIATGDLFFAPQD